MRGLFVVFEGLDKSGKSTQVNLLVNLINAVRISFPDRNLPTGRMIDHYLTSSDSLDDHAVHLLFSANRWEKCSFILDTLKSGRHIICDRYAYSGAAYTMSKGLNKVWSIMTDTGLPKPDLVFYMQADPEILAKRGNYGEERYEKIEFQKKVKLHFEEIFESQDNVEFINALYSEEDIYRYIKQKVETSLTVSSRDSIEKMW